MTNVAGVPESPPGWSHDGRQVVYTIDRADFDQEFEATAVRTQLVSLLGATRTDVTIEDWQLFDPRCSPDDVVLHARSGA
ncbi:MAG: hypothetical protein ACREMR_05130 [Gemmatimonadales bacterium]